MQLYCPNCQQAFVGRDHCPSCHTRMVTASEVFSNTHAMPALPVAALPPTVVERFVLGTLIALGLYLSLHEWCSAGLKSVLKTFDWDGSSGAIVSIILQALGVAVGSLVAGSGRKHGMGLGATIGLACSGLFLAWEFASDHAPTLNDAVASLALVVLATIGASIGCTRWPAPNELTEELPDPNESTVSKIFAQVQPMVRKSSLDWLPIVLCAVLSVVVILGADPLREFLRDHLGAILSMGGPAMAPMLDFEIASLMLIVAGVIAGAGNRHGLLQGVVAAILTISLIVAVTFTGMQTYKPVVEGMSHFMEMLFGEGQPLKGLGAFLIVIGVMTTINSWLGSQLLPPIKQKMKRQPYEL